MADETFAEAGRINELLRRPEVRRDLVSQDDEDTNEEQNDSPTRQSRVAAGGSSKD